MTNTFPINEKRLIKHFLKTYPSAHVYNRDKYAGFVYSDIKPFFQNCVDDLNLGDSVPERAAQGPLLP